MNTEELAREIYVEMAGHAPEELWDWQALAHRAFAAARQFKVVAEISAPEPASPMEKPSMVQGSWVTR